MNELDLTNSTPVLFSIPQVHIRTMHDTAATLETTVMVNSVAIRNDASALRSIVKDAATDTTKARGILLHAANVARSDTRPSPSEIRFLAILDGRLLRDVALFVTARLVRNPGPRCGPYEVKTYRVTPTFGRSVVMRTPEFLETRRSDYIVEVRTASSDRVQTALLEGGRSSCPSTPPTQYQPLVGAPPADASLISFARRLGETILAASEQELEAGASIIPKDGETRVDRPPL